LIRLDCGSHIEVQGEAEMAIPADKFREIFKGLEAATAQAFSGVWLRMSTGR
jgi:hypothetical protein